MTDLTIAFGLEPNPNHSGFFICKEKNIFDDAGLSVTFCFPGTSPDKSPLELLTSREADVALLSAERIIASTASGHAVRSIANVYQTDMLAFFAKGDKIESPKDLANCTLGTLGRPFEKELLEAMIRADGGQPNIKVKKLTSLDLIGALSDQGIDVVCGFQCWNSLLARHKGLKLVEFNPTKYGIPTIPSPCLAVLTDRLREADFMSKIQRLLSCLVRGYEDAAENPSETATIIKKWNVEPVLIVDEAQALASAAYVDKVTKRWGYMDPERWNDYLFFLRSLGVFSEPARSTPNHHFFSNEFVGAALRVEQKASEAAAAWASGITEAV